MVAFLILYSGGANRGQSRAERHQAQQPPTAIKVRATRGPVQPRVLPRSVVHARRFDTFLAIQITPIVTTQGPRDFNSRDNGAIPGGGGDVGTAAAHGFGLGAR